MTAETTTATTPAAVANKIVYLTAQECEHQQDLRAYVEAAEGKGAIVLASALDKRHGDTGFIAAVVADVSTFVESMRGDEVGMYCGISQMFPDEAPREIADAVTAFQAAQPAPRVRPSRSKAKAAPVEAAPVAEAAPKAARAPKVEVNAVELVAKVEAEIAAGRTPRLETKVGGLMTVETVELVEGKVKVAGKSVDASRRPDRSGTFLAAEFAARLRFQEAEVAA